MNFKDILAKGINEFKKGDFLYAEKTFKHGLRLSPKHIIIYSYLIPSLINQNKLDEALKQSEKLKRLKQNNEVSYIYIGIVFFKRGNFQNALDNFKMGLSINPKSYDLLLNIGVTYHKLGDNVNAIKYLDKSIEINNKNYMSYQNLGSVYRDISMYNESIESYKKAIAINPKDYDSIHGLSLLQLSTKDYKSGWQNYEYRFYLRSNSKVGVRHQHITRLQSIEELKDRKVLVWHEQGLGDTLQFSRYVNKLISIGADVTFEVQTALRSFLNGQLNCEITDNAEYKNKYDFQIPLLSLPRLFNELNEGIPPINNYFICNDSNKNMWKELLSLSVDKINIGIAISGNPNHLKNNLRSIELRNFINLTNLAKIFVIQKDLLNNDCKTLKENKEIVYLGNHKNWKDMSDTSAIVQNMDLVVSICTSLIHLSGTMNKKSLLLLSKPADWRWTEDNSTTPEWYDNLKILRQKKVGSWSNVVDDLEKEIKEFSNI